MFEIKHFCHNWNSFCWCLNPSKNFTRIQSFSWACFFLPEFFKAHTKPHCPSFFWMFQEHMQFHHFWNFAENPSVFANAQWWRQPAWITQANGALMRHWWNAHKMPMKLWKMWCNANEMPMQFVQCIGKNQCISKNWWVLSQNCKNPWNCACSKELTKTNVWQPLQEKLFHFVVIFLTTIFVCSLMFREKDTSKIYCWAESIRTTQKKAMSSDILCMCIPACQNVDFQTSSKCVTLKCHSNIMHCPIQSSDLLSVTLHLKQHWTWTKLAWKCNRILHTSLHWNCSLCKHFCKWT